MHRCLGDGRGTQRGQMVAIGLSEGGQEPSSYRGRAIVLKRRGSMHISHIGGVSPLDDLH